MTGTVPLLSYAGADATKGWQSSSRMTRWIGVAWVAITVPAIAVLGDRWATTPDRYIVMLVLSVSFCYTTPALYFGWKVSRNAPRSDGLGFGLMYTSLVGIKLIGLSLLVGVATGWTWGNVVGMPVLAVNGAGFCVGLALLVRPRSGHRSFAIDIVEAAGSIVAVLAPLVVLWGPTIVDARARWFATGAAVTFVFALWGTYWGLLLLVRLGPGRDALDLCSFGLVASGALNAALQTWQGVEGFTLPAPPLLAVHALCASMFLLIPLTVPRLLRPGRLGQLPAQAQVRSALMATLVGIAGLAALLGVTGVVQDERPWAVPFALGAVTVLFVLGALRQLLAGEETRRLYAQVEVAAEQRRRLLGQLLERSLQDRRRFAGQLYEQAMAAYTSFHVLAGAGDATGGHGLRSVSGGNRGPRAYGSRREGARSGRQSSRIAHPASGPALAEASARVSGELVRNAESVRGLVLAIKPADDERDLQHRLGLPITAYLDTLYADRPTPRLGVTVAPSVRLDWVAETVLLQVVQEALHNVWAHSGATAVEVSIEPTGTTAALRVHDNGCGFDPATTVERSGLATMRAAVAVIGGSLLVDTRPGGGATITARLSAADSGRDES